MGKSTPAAPVFVIKKGTLFFSVMNTRHFAAQFSSFEHAKKWKTQAAAESFLSKWINAGVGLSGSVESV